MISARATSAPAALQMRREGTLPGRGLAARARRCSAAAAHDALEPRALGALREQRGRWVAGPTHAFVLLKLSSSDAQSR